MEDIFYQLKNLYGSHCLVAERIGYSERQYRNIRKKVEQGKALPARIESLLLLKLQAAQENSPLVGSDSEARR